MKQEVYMFDKAAPETYVVEASSVNVYWKEQTMDKTKDNNLSKMS